MSAFISSVRFKSGFVFAALCLLLSLIVQTEQVFAHESDPRVLERNKDLIERFFTLVNDGNISELDEIVVEDYIEHADMPDRFFGLTEVVATNSDNPPAAAVEEERQRIRGQLVRMIAEYDHVWTYAEVSGPQGRVARVDMFRLEDERIVEHWAVVEQVDEDRQNDNSMFAAGRGDQDYHEQALRIDRVASEAELARNREVARLFYRYFEVNDDAGLRSIMREDYIQHNAGLPDGREPLLQGMPEARARAREESRPQAEGNNEIIRMLTEGNLVWVFIRDPAGDSAQFNQFRVEDGMLVDHWGSYQDVPASRQNSNTFFGFGRGAAADYSR